VNSGLFRKEDKTDVVYFGQRHKLDLDAKSLCKEKHRVKTPLVIAQKRALPSIAPPFRKYSHD